MARLLPLSCALIMVVWLIAAMPANAQSGGSAAESASNAINYFDFFVVKGGWIAFGLIALSVVTIALAAEHCFSIRRPAIVPAAALEHTKSLIENRKYVEAIQFTAEEPSMLGHVLHAGLLEGANGFAAMQRAIEEMLEDRSARLFRKTEYLHIIGNVSPMIGLLGTVTGMIMLFAEIHAEGAIPGARVVADRIAIALITTFWGLAVAIPALSVFAMFRNRIDVLTAECALAAESVLHLFKPGSSIPAGSPAGAAAPSAPSGSEAHANKS